MKTKKIDCLHGAIWQFCNQPASKPADKCSLKNKTYGEKSLHSDYSSQQLGSFSHDLRQVSFVDSRWLTRKTSTINPDHWQSNKKKSGQILFWNCSSDLHPWKINMKPENDGLEDHFPLNMGDL